MAKAPLAKARFRVVDGELAFLGRPLFGGARARLIDLVFGEGPRETAEVLVTLNVDQTLTAETDPRFARIVQTASIVTIDGAPISLLARMMGATAHERNTGADLLPAVAAEAKERGGTVLITGGADDVVHAAAAALRRSSGADIRSVEFPFIREASDERSRKVIAELHRARPAIVFLCLGSPKQEWWFDEWRDELPPALYIGAGAAVDFSAGRAKRAPSIIQKIGLEWVFRLAQEPRRLAHRYLVKGPRFIMVIARSLLGK